MRQQEKRIVALSVAVTLLGGWVTIGEAAEGDEHQWCYAEYVQGSCPDDVEAKCETECGGPVGIALCVHDSPHAGWSRIVCQN